MSAGARADSYTGTWSITPSSTPGRVHIELRYRRDDWRGTQDWDESHDAPAPPVKNNAFIIESDAGSFLAQGTFSNGQGGGTWTFAPNPAFRSELRRRGVEAPSDEEQFALAMSDFKLSSLDTLLAAGFAKPSAHDLVRMGEHGITDDYIAAMKGLQFSPKTIDSLVRLRDHGVTPNYMHDLAQMGYNPSADELVRLVDHGVTANFIERMRSHGYTHLSADDLIRLRDHGF
ncbi:MAG TPA: hypothetical protein VJP85_00985 [Candidatus Baltobacteraceae bacterium]|nr:hypothetical protein [Candidatus Baltobacteraceae bacterium]